MSTATLLEHLTNTIEPNGHRQFLVNCVSRNRFNPGGLQSPIDDHGLLMYRPRTGATLGKDEITGDLTISILCCSFCVSLVVWFRPHMR